MKKTLPKNGVKSVSQTWNDGQWRAYQAKKYVNSRIFSESRAKELLEIEKIYKHELGKIKKLTQRFEHKKGARR